MLTKPNLTIAIPTFNNYKQLSECLWTLINHVEYPFKIVVVNNGDPVDNLGVPFEEAFSWVRYPHFKILQNDSNQGWQKSINRAFEEECETEFFCMANDDLIFLPYHINFLRDLMSYFQYPEIGAVGPSTNFVMGPQNISRLDVPMVFETTLLIGFFMLVRSKAFADVGGLDEALIGGDDLDFSMRLREAGLKLIVDRSRFVHHIGAQTGPRVHQPQKSGDFEVAWNSQDHIDITNNQLIRRHGVEKWFETVDPQIELFSPTTHHYEFTEEEAWITKGCGSATRGLDLGCGNNPVEGALGVDKNPSGALGDAGGQAGHASKAVVQGDATCLQFKDESQDFVIAKHLLEHLIDPVKALQEWRRVLKPGGRLLIVCPDEDQYRSLLVDWTHVHAWTMEACVNLLTALGFSIVESKQIKPGLVFIIKAVRREYAKEEEIPLSNTPSLDQGVRAYSDGGVRPGDSGHLAQSGG